MGPAWWRSRSTRDTRAGVRRSTHTRVRFLRGPFTWLWRVLSRLQAAAYRCLGPSTPKADEIDRTCRILGIPCWPLDVEDERARRAERQRRPSWLRGEGRRDAERGYSIPRMWW